MKIKSNTTNNDSPQVAFRTLSEAFVRKKWN